MQEKLELYFKAKEAYYTGNSIMSDAAFDELENELREAGLLNENNEQVGYQSLNQKVKHINKMLSLDKIQVNEKTDDEFNKILKKCMEWGSINAWWKLDGCSLNIQASLTVVPKTEATIVEIIDILTRGNGEEGISVKSKLDNKAYLIMCDLIDKKVISKPGIYELRGEAIFKKSVFTEKYKNRFANARNGMAGTLNREFSEDDLEVYNDIDVIVYDVIDADGNYYDLGAEVYNVETLDDVKILFNEFHRQRDDFKYETDGFVIKMSDTVGRKLMGNSKTAPKWAVAVKFPSTIVQSEILDFEYTVTKQGTINVVAILKPVELDGTTVKRVNCANPQLMIDKGINKGAIISIKKSGDIIPMITEIIKASDSKEKCYPELCPVCNTKLDDSNLTHLRCVNEKCDGSAYEKFASGVKIFELEYCGDALLEKLYTKGMREGYEIFSVNIEEFLGEKHKNYLKVQQQLDVMREIELWKIIYSLQIKDSGKTISKELAKLFVGVEYSEFGLQRSVFQDFKDNYMKKLKEIIEKLELKNIKINYPKEEIKMENVIKFEMTGKTTPLFATKADFVSYLDSKYPNQYVHSSISKDSGSEFILFTNDKNSTTGKMGRALKQGITIKTYDEV